MYALIRDPPGGSYSKESAYNARDLGSVPGLRRSAEGNSKPLQCSCLENLRDRGAWRAHRESWGHKESDMTEWLTLWYMYALMHILVHKLPCSSPFISQWGCWVNECIVNIREIIDNHIFFPQIVVVAETSVSSMGSFNHILSSPGYYKCFNFYKSDRW